jgi:hypothetical protein
MDGLQQGKGTGSNSLTTIRGLKGFSGGKHEKDKYIFHETAYRDNPAWIFRAKQRL